MAKKVNNQGKGPTAPRQRLPQVVKQRPYVPFGSLIRQARLDPALLSPRELSQLQRTMGNQAVGRFLAQTAPVQAVQRKGNLLSGNGSGVIQAAFEDIFKVTGEDIFVLENGKVLTEAQGRGYMARITAGDASVLDELKIHGQEKIPGYLSEGITKQEREFGLGKDPNSDRCVIIAGLKGGVNWDNFKREDLIPLAHSHPYTIKRKLGEQVLISDLFNDEHFGTLVLPSVADLKLAANDKVPVHTVYTPYKVIKNEGKYYVTDDKFKVNNNNNNDNSNNNKVDVKDFLSFEICNAKTDDWQSEYVGTLKAIWDGNSILETPINASESDKATEPVKKGEVSIESNNNNNNNNDDDDIEYDLSEVNQGIDLNDDFFGDLTTLPVNEDLNKWLEQNDGEGESNNSNINVFLDNIEEEEQNKNNN